MTIMFHDSIAILLKMLRFSKCPIMERLKPNPMGIRYFNFKLSNSGCIDLSPKLIALLDTPLGSIFKI